MKNFYLKISSTLIFIIAFAQISNAQIYANVSVDSAYNIIQANIYNPDFIIMDVRTYGEYTSAHLENGVNLDRNDPNLESILDTLNKNKRYLVHCASGGRSAYVYGRMQTKGYAEVYNMLGGQGAWSTAGYSTTTMVAPIMLPVYDTIIPPTTVALGYTDSIAITITNYGNDTLKFLNITDLSGTEFSTNFNLNSRLTGFHDYTFKIYYTPVDVSTDSIVFTIESNGGTLQYPIVRDGYLLNVDLGADTSLCQNDTLILDAGAGYTSYLWSNGDTTQTITIDSSQVGLATAQFTVTITDNIYQASDTIFVTYEICSYIASHNSDTKLFLYPNPSNGIFNINKTVDLLYVYDIFGNLVRTYKNTSIIDLSDIAAGNYIAKIISNDNLITKKINLIK